LTAGVRYRPTWNVRICAALAADRIQGMNVAAVTTTPSTIAVANTSLLPM